LLSLCEFKYRGRNRQFQIVCVEEKKPQALRTAARRVRKLTAYETYQPRFAELRPHIARRKSKSPLPMQEHRPCCCMAPPQLALIGASACGRTGSRGNTPLADRGWKRAFDEPIPLPRGRQLVTLRDAGIYILKLPESEHTVPEWQAAMEALGLVATLGGPTMFARIGIMQALNRHDGREFKTDRKPHHWGKRKLARDE
jgi:hypothetical protein